MSRYLQSVVMRSRGEESKFLLMPRPYTRYETILSDGGKNGSGLSRGLENGERPMGPGLVSHDAGGDAAASCRPADVSLREPGDWGVGEAGESVQWPDEKERDQRAGGNGNRQARAEDSPASPRTYDSADRIGRSAGIGEPVGQPVQHEVVSASVVGADLLDGRARHKSPEPEPGGIVLSKQGRRVKETALPTPVSTQSEARSVDPRRPTLAAALLHRMHGEGLVSSAIDQPPVVRIHIGRIEVKAVHQPAATPGRKVVEAPRSSLPLDQYLRRGLREA